MRCRQALDKPNNGFRMNRIGCSRSVAFLSGNQGDDPAVLVEYGSAALSGVCRQFQLIGGGISVIAGLGTDISFIVYEVLLWKANRKNILAKTRGGGTYSIGQGGGAERKILVFHF